jgi:hypothetical protein
VRPLLLITLSLLMLLASSALAVASVPAHHLTGTEEFDKILDERCTVCHSRERVDVAIRDRQDMEKLQQQMEERGAVLNERDKAVLGTFWGSPLKEREPPTPAR